jgi:HAD superfamily hydrolase (TIGR01509 family)
MIHWNGAPIAAILFDMDGVIADTREAHKRTWGEFLQRYDFAFDPEEWMARTFGRGNGEILGVVFPEHAHDREFLWRKGEEKEEIFRALFRRGEAPAVPGVREFIALARRAGLRLAIGSSAPRGNIETILQTLGISDDFETIVSGEDAVNAKPDPEIFDRCRQAFKLDGSACVVLEDSLHGLTAAKASGCRAIGFTTMHSAEELAPHCAASVRDFFQLATLFGLGEDTRA